MKNYKKILLTTLIISSAVLTGCEDKLCPMTGMPPTTIEISNDETVTYSVLGLDNTNQNITISKANNRIKIKKVDGTEVYMEYKTSECDSARHQLEKGKTLNRLEQFLVERQRDSSVELVEVLTNKSSPQISLTLLDSQESEQSNYNVLGYTFDKVVTTKRIVSDGTNQYMYETKHVIEYNKAKPNNGLIYAKVTNTTNSTPTIEVTLSQWNGK